jgi:hypothetical protein
MCSLRSRTKLQQQKDSTKNLQLRKAARNDAVYVLLGDGATAAAWLRERTLWKTEERNTRRYKQTVEGGNGSQVPRANPGCHLELTESASFFFAGTFHFWCEISPKCEKKRKIFVFLHIIAKFPQHKNLNFFATFGI